MDIPIIKSHEDQAVDTLVAVLNAAKEALGERQTLKQFAASRNALSPPAKVSLSTLKCPLIVTSEELIRNAIEKTWKLTEHLMYFIKYIGDSKDECTHYYYFEAIFSQPIAAYPIPQATASVFFRVQNKQIEPPKVGSLPKLTFRIEGHHIDHDVRHVMLLPDWILAVIQMKMKLFKRIERGIQLF